jgi:hypothetical protein
MSEHRLHEILDERPSLRRRCGVPMHLSKQRLRLHAEWDRTTFALRCVDAFCGCQVELRDENPTTAAWF